MGQKKLKRFKEIKTFANVLEYPKDSKGKWKNFFKNDNPITLELACGKGEYTTALAAIHKQRNFIGVDIKGNRIWVGAKKALNDDLKNVAFLRCQIERVDEYFNPGEVSEIWITFPDPQLQLSKAKKRLTHPRFLRLYQKFLNSDGLIHLKTDSPNLYQFTKRVLELFECEILQDFGNLYADERVNDELKIKTFYESLDIAKSEVVHYLQFRLNAKLPEVKDGILKEELVHQV